MNSSFPIALALLFCLSGCFWRSHVNVQEKPFNIQITVADEASFKTGGTIAFTPLRAGHQASADDQLDRISLIIVKAVTDRLTEANSSLVVMAGDDEPDMVFQGYVDELTQNGRFRRVVLRKAKGHLAISGDIFISTTGVKVLTFSGFVDLKGYKDVFAAAKVLGESLGDEITARSMK